MNGDFSNLTDKTLHQESNLPTKESKGNQTCWYCKREARFRTTKTMGGQKQKVCAKCGALQMVVRN